jgi:alpha-mannosidase
LRAGYDPNGEPAGAPVVTTGSVMRNERYEIQAAIDAAGVRIIRDGKPLLNGDGLGVAVFDDPAGSWGAMTEDAADPMPMRQRWTIRDARVLDDGPQRSTLWVRFAGKDAPSRLDLTFHLYRDRDAIDVDARLMWDERAARLKLILPCGAQAATYDVPGAQITRGEVGETPGGRWVITDRVGFASDALYSFDLAGGELRPTIVRAAPYAATELWQPDDQPWTPAFDAGEHAFRFLIAPGDADRMRRLARELEQPVIVQLTPASDGPLSCSGSLISMLPASLEVLVIKPAEDGCGMVIRLRNPHATPAEARVSILRDNIALGTIAGGAIVTWRVNRDASGKWIAMKTSTTELDAC